MTKQLQYTVVYTYITVSAVCSKPVFYQSVSAGSTHSFSQLITIDMLVSLTPTCYINAATYSQCCGYMLYQSPDITRSSHGMQKSFLYRSSGVEWSVDQS